MMLTLVLFGAVFASITWILYAFRFIVSSLGGMSFFDAGIVNVLLYALFVCLPILIIWAIFGFISQYVYNRSVNRQIFKLFSQMKKNQEYSDLLARIMLETEQNIKNSFMLGRFDLMIADMNELLSEFLQRERLVTNEQIELLWSKVQNGGKWSFGKVVIENFNLQTGFQKKVFGNAQNDALLAGTILEFCARYQTLLGLLEKYDKERVLLNIIETGVFGKVFAILAPVADEIRRTREAFVSEKQEALNNDSDFLSPQKNKAEFESQREFDQPAKAAMIAESSVAYKEIGKRVTKVWEKFRPKKKEGVQNQQTNLQKDAFSLALERSFGKEEKIIKEPSFEKTVAFDSISTFRESEDEQNLQEKSNIDIAPQPIQEPVFGTQRTLDSLKKEWQGLAAKENKVELPKQDDEKTISPFSGWTDVENYQK